ncbi:MAG TPA: hypothetical protein PKD26_00975 [Pyrinomonadaceae bacterium]|nr:hypothetical protein [Pyrinomonadaceae bacterium]
MKNRILAFSCLSLLVLNLVGFASGDRKRNANRSDQLTAMLPTADGVISIDVKRFFSTALPKILSANEPMLKKVTDELDRMKDRTGIDIRQFDQLAAGVNAAQKGEKDYDVRPVVIARGGITSASLIGAAKIAANGKYREEKAADRTIYVFEARQIAADLKDKTPEAKDSSYASMVVDKLSGEMALTAIDANTVAFGDLALVKRAVDGSARMPAELLRMLGKKETAVVKFAGKLPGGMGAFLPLDNDELGKNIESIRYLYGNVDMVGEAMAVNMTAQTQQRGQAAALRETLEGLQLLGKMFLGSAKGADKQVYNRMIDNVKFTSSGNEVSMALQVPQQDIDILIGMLK